MKKIYSMMLLMLAAVWLSPALADIGGTLPGGGRWGYVSYNQEIWVSGDTIPDYSYTVYQKGHPMCPSGRDQIEITDAPWAGLQDLVKLIVIHSDVKYLGKNAFRGFYEVETVDNSRIDDDNLLYIADYAFCDCEKLSAMDFSHVSGLGDLAFAYTALAYAELPKVKYLGTYVFAGCQNMLRKEVENFVVVDNNIRPSVYINTSKTPQMKSGGLSNVTGSGGIEFLVLVPYKLRSVWGVNMNSHNHYRTVVGGHYDIDVNYRSFWYIKDGTQLVVSGDFGNMPDWTEAPWSVEKENVKKLYIFQTKHVGKNAFKDFTALREVVSDEHLTEIGESAFAGCTDMQKMQFDYVTKIGASAFKGSRGWFYTPSFPKCQEIGSSAFENCGNLYVRFGGDLKTIKANAFKGCSNLSLSITACPAPQVDATAFSGLTLSNIWLQVLAACPSSYAAAPWASMDKHYIADLPISGDEWSLSADGELQIWDKSVVKDYASPELVPWHGYREYITHVGYTYSNGNNNPKGVGAYMFCDMPNLKSAYFGSENAKIGKEAFANCPKLQDLGSSMNGVTEIGDFAFSGCSTMPHIVIHSSCTKLGKSVFYECDSLQNIYCYKETPPTVSSTTFNGLDQSNVVLHVDYMANYINATYWKNFMFEGNAEHGTITNTGTFYDGNFLLYNDGYLYCKANDGSQNKDATTDALYQIRTKVKEIVVEGEIASITDAFKGFSNVTKVTLPSTVTRLVQTFLSCSKLSEIAIPNVTYLGVNTFRDCSQLKNIDLPRVETIEQSCFEGSGITAINAANLKFIDQEAFKNCTNLTNVDLGNVVIKGSNVFKDCTKLNTVSFNGRVLKKGMFSGCSALKRVNLYDHVQEIEGDVFTGTALNTISYMRARPCWRNYSGYDNELSGIAAANITLYLPKACIPTYSNVTPWKYMNIQASSECPEDYKALPQYGFFADPDDRWTLNANNTLTVEADGAMTEWPSDYDLHSHPLEEWMANITKVEVVGSTTRTMDDLIPSDRDMGLPGITHIILGKNIEYVGRSFEQIYYIERVDCYAEDVPEIDDNAFYWSQVTNNSVPLHVSRKSGVKNAYKAHSLWKKFRIVDDLGDVYKVTLNAAHGYITVQEDVNLNVVPAGTVLHLTAVPLAGYQFVGWDNYNPSSGLTVNSDVTVRANFEAIERPHGFESIQASSANIQKTLHNGQLLILMPDGRIYNIQGQRIK